MSTVAHVRGRTPRRALLAFADAPALDMSRRRWPRAFAPLLAHPVWSTLGGEAIDCHLFTSRWMAPGDQPGVTVHRQTRGSFGRRLAGAVDSLAALGYQEVVIVGSDCPELSSGDVARAFGGLAGNRAVLGPDHKGGVYLIGLRTADRSLLTKVHWLRNTDFAQLCRLFGPDRTLRLPQKRDLDGLDDVRELASARHRLSGAARELIRRLAASAEAPLCLPPIDLTAGRRPSGRSPPA